MMLTNILKGCVVLAVMGFFFGRGEAVFSQELVLAGKKSPTIQVIVETSTWKTRGRLLYDVEGSILKKLSLAGFQAVNDRKQPHQYQLVVRYDEQRGAPYGVELWGTIIHVSFLFRGESMLKPLSWKITEISTNTVSGPAPYLDALLKFETHPHYFFLGSMLHKMTKGGITQPNALMQAVKEFVFVVYPTIDEIVKQDGVRIHDHFMDNSQRVYQDVALQRALDELVNQDLSDTILVPIAERLLDSGDPHSRIRAVQILGRSKNVAFQEKLKELAVKDPYHAVRQAAQKFSSL